MGHAEPAQTPHTALAATATAKAAASRKPRRRAPAARSCARPWRHGSLAAACPPIHSQIRTHHRAARSHVQEAAPAQLRPPPVATTAAIVIVIAIVLKQRVCL